MYYDYLDTPIGRLLVAADESGLRHVRFDDARRDQVITADWKRGATHLDRVIEQLHAYFAGGRHDFDLALAAEGTSVIHGAHHVRRGYENIEGKFLDLGAQIERVSEGTAVTN